MDHNNIKFVYYTYNHLDPLSPLGLYVLLRGSVRLVVVRKFPVSFVRMTGRIYLCDMCNDLLARGDRDREGETSISVYILTKIS